MRIQIASRLRPFSHSPGTSVLLPFTTWEVKVFPAKLVFSNLAGAEREEIVLPILGPVQGFTVMQNLEKGRIEVFGRGKAGYFRYLITADHIQFLNGNKIILPFITKFTIPPSEMRLSLGDHKKQDWDLVKRRADMSEVLPFWLRLSALIPPQSLPQEPFGNYSLLAKIEEKQSIVPYFQNLFQSAFHGIFSPCVRDEKFLGLFPEKEIPQTVCPIPLLHQGAEQIKSLFFVEKEGAISLLPSLPKEFHAGRFLKIKTMQGDLIDLEWSKKQIKKVIVTPANTHPLQLVLPREIRSFRVRKGLQQTGERQDTDQPLALHQGQRLYLDRFEK